MLSWISANLIPLLLSLVGVSGIGALLSVLIKKFLTEEIWEKWREKLYGWIEAIVRPFFKGVGVVITLGLSKWKYTKKLWNNILEPVVIALLDFIVGGLISILKAIAGGLKDGLTTDNDSFNSGDPA